MTRITNVVVLILSLIFQVDLRGALRQEPGKTKARFCVISSFFIETTE